MFRTVVAKKESYNVSMARLPAALQVQLIADLMTNGFNQVTLLDPVTNTQRVKTMYTSAVTCGSMRYVKDTGDTMYDGVAFSMIER